MIYLAFYCISCYAFILGVVWSEDEELQELMINGLLRHELLFITMIFAPISVPILIISHLKKDS